MTPVWSGGVAFSYFPAQSDQGQFGLVDISTDNTTATPNSSGDFGRLQAQYNNVTFINSPTQGSSAATYPSCPSANDTFSASTNLPPTPNESACDCLEQALSCRFTPITSDYSVIVGQLIDTACGLIGSKNGNCNDIGGGNGTYGIVSGCDPSK